MIEDQIEEITIKAEPYVPMMESLQQDNLGPHLVITEEPATSVRFRYPSEGNSHGGIPGAMSNEFRKTCPTVEIVGYKGHVNIVVQLVTDDTEPKLHVHSLVGKQCSNGICSVNCGPGEMRSQFPNLGIQHVKKKDAEKIICNRLREEYQGQLTEKDIKDRAKSEVERMNLSAVRLMFVAYLPDENNEMTQMLPPVCSRIIMDNKSTLKICRLSCVDSPATGGTEVFLLCDKVQKDDIQVRMFEVDAAHNEIWEDYCRFSPTDVHRQYAIVMRTPPYKNTNIGRPTKVYIQLRRKSDGQFSQPLQFTYTPVYNDSEFAAKRKRPNCGITNSFPSQFGTSGGVTANGYRRPINKGKPKVEHHVKPIDPSLLMRQFNRTTKPQQTQQTASYTSQQTTMQGTNFSQSMVMSSSSNLFQNFNMQSMSTVTAQGVTSLSTMNAMSPQSMGVGSPLQNAGSPGQPIKPLSVGSPYSNPGSVGMSERSSGSPFSQMSPSPIHPLSPSQQNHMSPQPTGQMSNLPCVPGTNIPQPGALGNMLQQNQVSSMQMFSQGSNTAHIYSPMQNVQANGYSGCDQSFSQQETDRQAFGDNCESVLDQLDFDNEHGKVPSLGSQFVEHLLSESINTFQHSMDRGIPIIQSDSTAIDSSNQTATENDEDFGSAMQESCDEEHDQRSTDEIFVEQLLQTVTKNIRNSIMDFRRTKKADSLHYAEQLFTKVYDRNNNTCLHLAALNGQSDLLVKLVKLSSMVKNDGSLLNVCNSDQQTPLYLAISCKDVSAVNCLIEAGADPKIVDGSGNSGVHLACSMGQPEMLTAVLKVVDTCDEMYNYDGLTPLHLLVNSKSEGSCQCLQALQAHDVNVEERELKSGQTALHMAVEGGNIMAMAILIQECGTDVDATTFNGLTPLHIAAAQGNANMVKILLALGADRDASYCEDEDGSPLSVAANDEVKSLLQDDAIDWSGLKGKIERLFEAGSSSIQRELLDILDIGNKTEELGARMENLAIAGSQQTALH